jgi:monofunctional biosynthetic peptidoglycan transglycosylase
MKELIKKRIPKWILLLLSLLLLLVPVYMYFSHDVRVLTKMYPHLKIEKGEVSEIDFKNQKPKSWTNLEAISPYAKGAIVLSEDWAFFDHDGVDLEQVKVALSEMVDGERFRGASTITQQMVKNIYLSHYPTLWRKFHEIILSQKVEKELSKKRILEIYLNCIEYGPGLFGIREASQHYFKKAPSDLTAKESAFIAMLLPSPKKYYVSFKKRELTKFAKSRIQAILKKMKMGKVISQEQLESELATPLSWE